MSRRRIATLVFAVLSACATLELSASPTDGPPAPDFTQTDPIAWINSPPLDWRQLRGKVVLLDVWTFDCWNCYRSFPWLNDLHQRYAEQGFEIIGIHSPEFQHERERAAVERKAAEFGLHHPIMLDNDFGYWRALGNRYWPSFYLIDKQGRIRQREVGEMHTGDRAAEALEAGLRRLLEEGS